MYTSGQQHKDLTDTTKPKELSFDNTWATIVEKLAAISLMLAVFLGMALLWWPSVPGWRYLCVTIPAVFVCWITGRMISGHTQIPGNLYHIPIIVILMFATYHGLKDGLARSSQWPYTLEGQFSGSLGLQFFLFALLIMLCDDLLTGKKFILNAIIAAGALTGSIFGLLVSTNPAGRQMLIFIAISACASCIKLIMPMILGLGERFKAGSIVFKYLYAIALAASAAILAPFAWHGAASIAGNFTLSGFGDMGLRFLPDYQPAIATLGAAVGVFGAVAIPAGFVFSVTRTSVHVFRDRRSFPAAMAACDILALSAAIAAWLSPMGLFTPAVIILLAINLSGNARIYSAKNPPVSGIFLLGATAWLCMLLGMISNMGLMVWVMGDIDNRDMPLHILFGWLITQMLMWLMIRWRWGAIISLVVSLGISAGGELAQKLWSQRSYQMDDFLHHCAGAALALGIFVLCRLAANSQTKNGKPLS